MGLAHGFAIPACALGVRLTEELLVELACLGEGIVEFGLRDFVIVVNKLSCFSNRVVEVLARLQLMRVPREVNVERRYSKITAVASEYLKEAIVLSDQAGHRRW